ncbi:hypothetical protein L198_05362 [Cryptococcus wingfieldii CBS 7118]|uniref:Uncharacterized protein n=1 Tax=Cryptococcus wingfieldii CBS 7118 TaxID=1295528 RepID=A0A1E3IY01_9TREE|nr:hypothetical protein L198_05362 [Cryptococcus wingfieldii CBS 7118]ODN93497.1 hypothetical protein L198_05362 [Cryptococcus wingfieldii CBS 7118]
MVFGQSDSEAAQQHITPNVFKSDADQAKEGVQQDVRHATSGTHHQAEDAIRPDAGGITSALKPSGEQSLGEQAQQKAGQIGSEVQPNDTKSATRQTKDFVTPGNDSAGAGGILNQIKNKVTGNEHKGTH